MVKDVLRGERILLLFISQYLHKPLDDVGGVIMCCLLVPTHTQARLQGNDVDFEMHSGVPSRLFTPWEYIALDM